MSPIAVQLTPNKSAIDKTLPNEPHPEASTSFFFFLLFAKDAIKSPSALVDGTLGNLRESGQESYIY